MVYTVKDSEVISFLSADIYFHEITIKQFELVWFFIFTLHLFILIIIRPWVI